jgi:ABC-type lipoprotein release transport system permease subunit
MSFNEYGLLSYEVARRTKEIGVRMALGAQRQQVLNLVVNEGILLAIGGGVFGAAAAFGVTRGIASLLYGVRPLDPFTFAAVGALLLAVAVAACLIPARRAAPRAWIPWSRCDTSSRGQISSSRAVRAVALRASVPMALRARLNCV